MVTAVPKTKVEEAIEQLSHIGRTSMQVSAIELQRLKRDIDSSLHIDPYMYHIASGMMAVVKWDNALLDVHMRAAISYWNNWGAHEHYATSLQMLCRISEAAVEACLASELAPTDLSALAKAIRYNFMAGKIEVAKQLLDTYKLRSPQKPFPEEGAILDAYQILKANGISEAVVERCNEAAFSLLREKNISFESVNTASDLEDKIVMCFIHLNLTSEEVSLLDEELTPRLFEIEEFRPDIYWVGFDKAPEYEH